LRHPELAARDVAALQRLAQLAEALLARVAVDPRRRALAVAARHVQLARPHRQAREVLLEAPVERAQPAARRLELDADLEALRLLPLAHAAEQDDEAVAPHPVALGQRRLERVIAHDDAQLIRSGVELLEVRPELIERLVDARVEEDDL